MSSPAPSSAPPSSPGPEATDDGAAARRAKAQARKDKLLARGADRLAKITNTAKSSDGPARFVGSSDIPVRPPNVERASSSSVARLPADTDDPAEVDIGTEQRAQQQEMMRQLMLMSGGGPNGSFADQFSGDGQVPLLQRGFGMEEDQPVPPFIAQMLGGAGGPGGLGAGLGKDGPLGGGMGFPPGLGALPRRKNWLDRIYPILQAVCMAALVVMAVKVWEPVMRGRGDGVDAVNGLVEGWSDEKLMGEERTWEAGEVDWRGWARLGNHRPGKWSLLSSVGQVPLLWLFVTVELVLQTTRIMVFRSRPPSPAIGLLSLVSPHLPPNLNLTIQTGLRYWALLGAFIDDLCVVVFGLGLWIAYAEWRAQGPTADGTRNVIDIMSEVAGQMAKRDEL